MNAQNKNLSIKEINGDFSTPVIVKVNLYDWHLKNETDIIRKRLEHINSGGSRQTSLVQFPPGLTFKKCSHNRGEEFLVLSGDFSNDKKKFSPGTYVRNPPGRQFTSATKTGCTLLFKTGQFQKLDNKRLIVHPYDHENSWKTTREPGVSCNELYQFLDETVSLYKIRPQCWITFRQQTHSIEILICEGSVKVGGIEFTTGTWFRYPPNSRIKITASSAVCLFVKKSKMNSKVHSN